MSGWIRMERALYEHEALKGPLEWGCWGWLIANAAWRRKAVDRAGCKIDLEEGQLCFSLRFLAEKWGVTKDKTKRLLDKWQKWNLITIESATGGSVITICNYSKYQLVESESATASRHEVRQERDSNPTESATKKNNITNKQGNKKPASTGVDTFLENIQSAELFPADVTSKKRKSQSASRIAEDWALSEKGWEFALGKGLSPDQIEWQAQLFLNYWIQSSSKTAVKRDWDAAWRTWAMRAVERIIQSNETQPDTTRTAVSNMLSKGFLDE
ncbi:hypothetical protein SAMN04488518_113146 [Pseudovibrio ascidiaceicola]|uniref:Phage replication protein O n=1 Tax=Pseudovibrio ascidiaceicola TaxID=285279 RepID=A0A1I4E3S9_9HYPH|nr:hypothetical protein [Pseudovibrio ascidiaceicola]SFK99809.1 hypothetical protein SAMN04488518_113146 [Pseudovibrio ascidiaceicola]